MKKNEISLVVIISIIVIIGLFLTLNYTGFAVQDDKTDVSRYIRDSTRKNSDKTRVYVRLYATSFGEALGISEKIPDGFEVTSSSPEGVISEGSIEWLFVPAKRTIIYYYIESVQDTKEISFSGNWYTTKDKGEISGNSVLNRK